MKTIGDRIREQRKYKGLSQEQLAKKIGISVMSVRRYESSDRTPTEKVLTAISSALDIDVNWLINGYTLDERRQAMVDYAKNRRVEVQAEKQILDGLQLLNAEGKKKIADYIDDLIKSGKYQIQRSKALDGIRLEVYGDGPAGNFPPKPDTSSAQEGGNNIAINTEDDE